MSRKLQYFLPGLSQCWVIVFFIIVIGGLGAGTAMSAICSMAGIELASLNPLVSYLVPLIPALLYIFMAKGNWETAVPLEQTPARLGLPLYVLYPLMAFCIIAIGFITEPLSSWMPMPESIQAIYDKMLTQTGWAFATTVVAAPVIEEFILRGVMERGLIKQASPKAAILYSAFFFALIHLNPWQATGAFIAGLFIGWIYWRTHSLIACIFIHMTNNGVAFLSQLVFAEKGSTLTYKELIDTASDCLYWIVFVIFAVLLGLALNLMQKHLPKENF